MPISSPLNIQVGPQICQIVLENNSHHSSSVNNCSINGIISNGDYENNNFSDTQNENLISVQESKKIYTSSSIPNFLTRRHSWSKRASCQQLQGIEVKQRARHDTHINSDLFLNTNKIMSHSCTNDNLIKNNNNIVLQQIENTKSVSVYLI
jgi:hypothetical protein